MVRDPLGPSREARLYRQAAVVVFAAVLVILGLLLVGSLEPGARQVVSTVGLLLGGISSIAATAYRFRRSTGRRRRAWALMTTALALGIAGNAWNTAVDLASAPPEAAALGDLGFLLALLFGIAGLLSFPMVPRRGTETARMVLDGVLVGGSVLYVASQAVYPGLAAGGSESPVRHVLALVIPLFDVILATVAILLIVRVSQADRRALALLGAGLVLYALADLAFAAQSVQEGFSLGSVTDIGWIAGYGLVVLAALHPGAEEVTDGDTLSEGSPVMGTALMFGLFLTAAVLGYVSAGEGGVAGSGLGPPVWFGVLVAVAARQILLIIDNENLRRGLEERVRERTAELSELTAQRELLLQSVGDGIYGVDRQGRVTFVNPAAEHTLGRRAADLIGRVAHEAFHAPRPDGSQYAVDECYVTEAIAHGHSTVVEEDRYRGPGGREFPVEVTASPLTSDDGVQGAVVVFRDVTERREVERMKDEFVSIVSHELRTPLTAIRGSLGLVAGGALGDIPPKALRMIEIATDSSSRLGRLINDILDAEHIAAGAPMKIADHAAAVLIDDAVDQVRVVAAQAGVTIERGRVEGRVRADADRVIQTLINLLGNAIKFAPSRTPVEIEAVEDGDSVLFRVSDQGRGIPADRLETVFGRFEQVDSSDARDRGGSGLGLTISRSIVEALGGRIWVESTPGAGADFRFTLPRAAG